MKSLMKSKCGNWLKKSTLTLALLPFLWPQADLQAQEELTIMSTRKQALVAPVLEVYTQKSGTAINFIQVSRQEMLAAYGTPKTAGVDIYWANDIAALLAGEEADALQPLQSERLERDVPEPYRCEENLWFANTARARGIIYNPERVQASQLLSYALLATPNWQGRLCLRDGDSPYNLFLISTLIHRYGKEDATRILQGWKDNLAIPPTKKGTQAIMAVADGQCDVTIANHYHFTRLKAEQPDLKVAIFWPDQNAQGVHMGLTGFALAKNSQNRESATALLEWLAAEEGQKLLTDLNDEFPVNTQVPDSKAAAILGAFKKDPLPLDDLIDDIDAAQRLVDDVGLGLSSQGK